MKGEVLKQQDTEHQETNKNVIISIRIPKQGCCILIMFIEDYEKWPGGVSKLVEFLPKMQTLSPVKIVSPGYYP